MLKTTFSPSTEEGRVATRTTSRQFAWASKKHVPSVHHRVKLQQETQADNSLGHRSQVCTRSLTSRQVMPRTMELRARDQLMRLADAARPSHRRAMGWVGKGRVGVLGTESGDSLQGNQLDGGQFVYEGILVTKLDSLWLPAMIFGGNPLPNGWWTKTSSYMTSTRGPLSEIHTPSRKPQVGWLISGSDSVSQSLRTSKRSERPGQFLKRGVRISSLGLFSCLGLL